MAFPNFKNKHGKDSLFTPREFLAYQKKRGRVLKTKPPEGVIFCYSRRWLGHILKHHKVKKVEAPFWGDFYLISETKGKVGLMANFGIGAPIAAALMDELIALGVKRFITIGEAGTLQKHIKIKDIVVCSKAIRDEGTSYHYLKPSKYAHASHPMIKRIEQAFHQRKQRYILGTSWTIDAPYRETVAEARHYQKEGVATVEMEAAALFAVAQHRKVEVGAIFTISDSLAELVWKPKFHLSETNWEILFQVAKEALLVKIPDRFGSALHKIL